jgi:hypothetical protein
MAAAARERVTLPPTDDPGGRSRQTLKEMACAKSLNVFKRGQQRRGSRGSAAGTTSDARSRTRSARARRESHARVEWTPSSSPPTPRAHAPARTLGTLGTALTTAASKTKGTNKKHNGEDG